MINYANTNQKKTVIAIVSDKLDFEVRSIIWDEKR